MAVGKKTGGRNFQPGNNFGKGRVPYPEEYKAIRDLDKNILKKIISKYLLMNVHELRDSLENIVNMTAIEGYVATLIAEGMTKKNYAILEWLALRSIGKVESEAADVINEQNLHSELVSFFKERKAALEEKK